MQISKSERHLSRKLGEHNHFLILKCLSFSATQTDSRILKHCLFNSPCSDDCGTVICLEAVSSLPKVNSPSCSLIALVFNKWDLQQTWIKHKENPCFKNHPPFRVWTNLTFSFKILTSIFYLFIYLWLKKWKWLCWCFCINSNSLMVQIPEGSLLRQPRSPVTSSACCGAGKLWFAFQTSLYANRGTCRIWFFSIGLCIFFLKIKY